MTTTLDPTTLTYDQLQREARKNITTIDLNLNNLSKLLILTDQAKTNEEGLPDKSLNARQVFQECKEDIEKFQSLIELIEDKLATPIDGEESKFLNQDTSTNLSLRRFRNKLTEFTNSADRLEVKVIQFDQRASLFGGSTKVSSGANNTSIREPQSEAEYFMGERTQLDNSYAMTDATLNQAYAIRSELADQGSSISNSTSRVSNLTLSIPGISGILNRISLRRSRDTIILGSVIAVGTLILLFFRL